MLCEAAAIAEIEPDGQAHVRGYDAVVSFDQAAQTMNVRVPLPYTKDGAEREAFVICAPAHAGFVAPWRRNRSGNHRRRTVM